MFWIADAKLTVVSASDVMLLVVDADDTNMSCKSPLPSALVPTKITSKSPVFARVPSSSTGSSNAAYVLDLAV